ncbi:MAG: YbhB/YbcL family Raf kinase inhibitor-like protein [Deltaproteobacteria bacterium]|nr:YbhB/YbcL family Raf kinase inhibitor-like protein [Deltaproteobacteria bacterium]
MAFTISSPDIQEGKTVPKEFTCDGANISPELVWKDAPVGAKSLVLIVEDPDAPSGAFTHWVVYDIPATVNRLEKGALPSGVKQGLTDFGYARYGGPCPPKGHGEHRYYFMLKALDVPSLGIRDSAKRAEVEKAFKGHALAETRLMGRYGR